MFERSAPRSRLETRAAVLEELLKSNGLFRQEIATGSRLTEASVSRILSNLRSLRIVDETRTAAPYAGGPTGLVTLSKNISVLGIELSNDRLSVGIGDLAGSTDYVERQPAGPGITQDSFERLFLRAMEAVGTWAAENGRGIRQAALSMPGLMPGLAVGEGETNAILPWDMTRLRAFVTDALGEVPLALTNSVIAQAAFHRYRAPHGYPAVGDHLLVFVGNGVAGVVVNPERPFDTFSPFELGHTIIERGGAVCRCGHRGCLEAYTSLKAVSGVLGLPADDTLRHGDKFMDQIAVSDDQRVRLRDMMRLLGVGVGNALNLAWLPSVVICGWPALMAQEDRAEIVKGMSESLLGGVKPERPQIEYVAPVIGNDPRAALAYAAHAFARAGGTDLEFSLRAGASLSRSYS